MLHGGLPERLRPNETGQSPEGLRPNETGQPPSRGSSSSFNPWRAQIEEQHAEQQAQRELHEETQPEGAKRKRNTLDEDAPAVEEQKQKRHEERNEKLEEIIQNVHSRTIENLKNQSKKHYSSLITAINRVKENCEHIKKLISSIEISIQAIEEEIPIPDSIRPYMQSGYVDKLRETFKADQNRLKSDINTNASKNEAKGANDRFEALIKDPTPKTLEDFYRFKASLEKQMDIKIKNFGRAKKIHEEHSVIQAKFIEDLKLTEERLTAHISGPGQSNPFDDITPFVPPSGSPEPLDSDEKMADIAKTGPRSSQGSPHTSIEGSPSHSNTESLDLDDIGEIINAAKIRQSDRLSLFGGTGLFGPGEITGITEPTSPKITEAPGSPPPDLSPNRPLDEDDL